MAVPSAEVSSWTDLWALGTPLGLVPQALALLHMLVGVNSQVLLVLNSLECGKSEGSVGGSIASVAVCGSCCPAWTVHGSGTPSSVGSDLVDRDEGAMRSHEALSSSQPVPALPLPPQSGLSERSSRRDLCREHESHPVSSPLKTLGAFLLYGLTEVSARPCEAPCGLSLRFPALL